MSIYFTDAITCELQKANAADLDVVNAARLSFDEEHPELQAGDDKLISFLVRKKHGSPFEHNYFKFRMEVPIAEFRDHVRHRVGHSYNEMSARYTILEPKFYVPEHARKQHGKPGEYYFEDEPDGSALTKELHEELHNSYRASWDTYTYLLGQDIAKEQARLVLPVGIFTKVIWSVNARSLMNFLELRNHPTAMYEIQVVAQQAEQALKEHMPITYQAFLDNGRIAP